jgi:hypothetical protein
MPAIILFVWLLTHSGNVQARTEGIIWICILILATQQSTSKHRQQYVLVDLPAGRVATTSERADKLTWLAQHTRPNDFLFEPGWPGSYMPLQLRNPVFIDEFDSGGMTPPEYVGSSMRQLDAKAVQYVLWSPRLEFFVPQKGDADDHLAAFRAYLEEHYRPVHIFSDADQLWERNDR